MALVAGDDEYCNAAAGQVLLVRDPLIGGDQQLVSVAFSLVQQFAVSERVPVALKGGVRLVVRQVGCEQPGDVVVQQYPHLRSVAPGS